MIGSSSTSLTFTFTRTPLRRNLVKRGSSGALSVDVPCDFFGAVAEGLVDFIGECVFALLGNRGYGVDFFA